MWAGLSCADKGFRSPRSGRSLRRGETILPLRMATALLAEGIGAAILSVGIAAFQRASILASVAASMKAWRAISGEMSPRIASWHARLAALYLSLPGSRQLAESSAIASRAFSTVRTSPTIPTEIETGLENHPSTMAAPL
jgi:hypothetical protein